MKYYQICSLFFFACFTRGIFNSTVVFVERVDQKKIEIDFINPDGFW